MRYDEKVINSTTKVKYLGISISWNMFFIGHFEAIVEMKNSLRHVTRKECRLNRRIVLVLYRGLFVPVMDYGSLLWVDSMQMPKERQLMLRAQRSVLYTALPFCRPVSLAAMQVIAGQLPGI